MYELRRRSRLVSLTYEVLRDVKLPKEEATTEAMLGALIQACLEKAASLAIAEGAAEGDAVSRQLPRQSRVRSFPSAGPEALAGQTDNVP